MKKRVALMFAGFLLLQSGIGWIPVSAEGESETAVDINDEDNTIRILFTQDLHSAVNGTKTEIQSVSTNEDGSEEISYSTVLSGGYSYLKNAIDTYRTEKTIVLDGGDFSHGSIYDGLYTKEGVELHLLQAMGYDVAAVGEHEFLYGTEAFGQMLETCSEQPVLLGGNLNLDEDSALLNIWRAHNGRQYTIIDKGGYSVGIFSISEEGCDPDGVMPIKDPVEAANDILDNLANADLKVCIYQCKDDDEYHHVNDLVKKCDGIDMIILTHQGKVLEEPLMVDNTMVVSAGLEGRFLGLVDVNVQSGEKTYELIPVDRSVFAADADIQAMIKTYDAGVQANVMNRYGFTTHQVIAETPYSFENINEADSFANNNMAELLADACAEAYERQEGDNHPVISIISRQMVTGTLLKGNVTIDDIYAACAYGIDDYGIIGEPLVQVYMKGNDLFDLCEIDSSMFADHPEWQMYFGNMYYQYNEDRGYLNQVEEVYVGSTKQYYTPIDKDRLYPVVTTETILNRLSEYAAMTDGDLSVVARNSSGYAAGGVSRYALSDSSGAQVKCWTALAAHLRTMERNSSNVAIIDEEYASGRISRSEDTKFDLIRFFKNTSASGLREYEQIAVKVLGALIAVRILIWLLNWKPRKQNI